MGLDARLRTYLVNEKLVDERVYPVRMADKPTYPLIVFNQVTGVPANHRDGAIAGWAYKALRVYSKAHAEASNIAAKLKSLVPGFASGQVTNVIDGYETESHSYYFVVYAKFWDTGT